MTVKCIALLKRRTAMSTGAFVAYYETQHAPLIASLFPEIRDYRRNYLITEGAFIFPAAAAPDFDVVTQITFDDRSAYDRFIERASLPDIALRIAEDEENLFDREMTRMFLVDQRASSLPVSADAMPSPPELRELIDERAIRRGLARFARILDTKDWPALGEVFADDLTFDYGQGGERSGMAALVDNMSRYLDRCGGTQHLLGSIWVDIAGDTALSRSYVQARHQRADTPAGAIFDSNGEYIDHWERRQEGWRIVRRDALWQAHTGDPAIIAAGKDDLG